MAKILCLAPSGWGKSSGILTIKELDFKGLNPKDTFIISVTSKPLPYAGSSKVWATTDINNLTKGRRIITNNAKTIADIVTRLHKSPIKNVVIDDFNYIMQDWFMANALRTGWDAPKQIGSDMAKIFRALELFQEPSKNVIILAHSEEVKLANGRVYMKMKTTGKMVDEYITPEGKFDVTLIGRSYYDDTLKKIIKEYVTNEDEFFASSKSPIGMFPLYISNDLGMIVERVNEYYLGL